MKKLIPLLLLALLIPILSIGASFSINSGTSKVGDLVINDINVTNTIYNTNQVYETNFFSSTVYINLTNYYILTNYVTSIANPPVVETNSGGNWYVRTATQGSGNGKDWNNAWAISSISWSSIKPGDTIWLAGGTYNTSLQILKNGDSTNSIVIKRATASQSTPSGSAGWSTSLDTQVVITSGVRYYTANLGSYAIIDGVIPDGIKLSFAATSFDSCAVFFGAGGMHDVTFTNIDMAGPGGATAYNFQGDCSAIALRPSINGGGSVYNIKVVDSKLHGGPNLVYNLGANYNFTFLRCKFYDNGSANSSIHANMVYTSGGNYNWYFINCEFSNWQVEGINLYQQTTHPHYIIGCVFHSPMSSSARCFWLANESYSPTGPVYLYNNTFIGVNVTISESRASMATSNSISRNNIFWNSTFAGSSSIANSDYNFSNGSIIGNNSISLGSNPFIDLANKNYKIVSTIGAEYPKDKGVLIPNIDNTDLFKKVRGQDGLWDIGAFED